MKRSAFAAGIMLCVLASCGSDGGSKNNFLYDSADTVAIYKFDETTGSIAVNSAQNRYHGNVYGASRVAGKVGNALLFGAAGSRIEISIPYPFMTFPSGEISIDTWIKPDAAALSSSYVLMGDHVGRSTSFSLRLNSGQLQFFLNDGYAWRSVISSNQTLAADTWSHIAVTYDGTTAVVYINGVEDATSTISYTVLDSYNTLYIGYDLPGTLDEVRLFRVRLSASEVAAYYDLTK